MRIVGNIEVEGWANLAKALSLAPSGWVHFVFTSADLMREGRRGDLRTVWESLSSVWDVGNERFLKHGGERAWRGLERRLDKN